MTKFENDRAKFIAWTHEVDWKAHAAQKAAEDTVRKARKALPTHAAAIASWSDGGDAHEAEANAAGLRWPDEVDVPLLLGWDHDQWTSLHRGEEASELLQHLGIEEAVAAWSAARYAEAEKQKRRRRQQLSFQRAAERSMRKREAEQQQCKGQLAAIHPDLVAQ
jgi:hypothetical protein